MDADDREFVQRQWMDDKFHVRVRGNGYLRDVRAPLDRSYSLSDNCGNNCIWYGDQQKRRSIRISFVAAKMH